MNQNRNRGTKKTETFYETEKFNIGNRLRDFRQSHKWSQEDFCGQLSQYSLIYSLMQISRIETGQKPLTADILYFLHKKYHVDLNELICGSEDSDINGQALFHDLEALYQKYRTSSDRKR